VARRTYEVRVPVNPRDVNHLAERFIRAGSGGVEERTARGRTWLVMYAGSRAEAKRLADVAAVDSVEIGEVAPGWDTRFAEYLQPERISERVELAPVGDPGAPPDGVTRLWFEPGPVFGVGSHATTRLAARAVESECQKHPPDSLLDVGTGTGVLAMVGVLSGAKRALGIDVDRAAVVSARKNARLNGLERRCRFSQRALASIRDRYPLVVANVETRILVGLLPDLVRVTSRCLLLTGILEEHAADVNESCGALSVKPNAVNRENGWVLYRIDR
jgi:ribosomal protein L11 methyltransferase